MSAKANIPLVSLLTFIIAQNATEAIDPVPLGTSANYAILAQTAITTTGNTAITGNVAVSPISSAAMTGFGLVRSSDGTSSTSSLVRGSVYAADYSSPTPSILTTAVNDITKAYNNAAGRINPDFLNVGAGNLIGVTLTPGLHKWTSAVTLGGIITFIGSPSDVFILQVSGALTFSPSSQIVLLGGALPKNIFFQVAGQATLGVSAQVQGVILGKTGIAFGPGASLNPGRAFAGTAITLIGNTIGQP